MMNQILIGVGILIATIAVCLLVMGGVSALKLEPLTGAMIVGLSLSWVVFLGVFLFIHNRWSNK